MAVRCSCVSSVFYSFSDMFQAHILSVSVVFMCMFQLFHADVAKVDQDVAHVAIVVHVCCKCLFSVFQLFLYTYFLRLF
jgi:hypothetical protein